MVLSEWHISPITIETEWTSEYYNMMLIHYLQRKTDEGSSKGNYNNGKSNEKTPESLLHKSLNFGPVRPYPNIINIKK